MNDFLIVGGGINGLLLARELAAAGAKLTLLDKGMCGKEASWAGGGIISPLYPWNYPNEITALASWAQSYYPALVAELYEETGIDAELNRSGLLMLAAEEASAALTWASGSQRVMELIEGPALYKKVPCLAPGFDSGLWMPEVSNVRNPRLIKALVKSLSQNTNVTICENSEVTEFELEKNRVQGVFARCAGQLQNYRANNTVICSGAWSGELAKRSGFPVVDVVPVKGQMILYKLEKQLTSSILLTAGKYIIPREDGHLLIGSTLEHTAFDKTPTAEGLVNLQKAAFELLPELQNYTPIGQWAGLRPWARDGLPYIGRIEEFENLFINAGQYRNGLVLAPASARVLADYMLDRDSVLNISPYLPSAHRRI